MKENKCANIGIDIGGSHIGYALVNESGNILFKSSIDIHNNHKADNIINQLLNVIIKLNDKTLEYNKIPVSNIGIGIPGIINSEKGIIEFSPNIKEFNNFKITSSLKSKLKSEKLNIPVFIENDANCAAFGEYKFGWGDTLRKKNLIHLTLGTGVGSGIIINGKIFRGCTNNAGEIGHMTIKFDGRKCSCGNTGCLEAYAGAAGFIETATEILKSNKNSLIWKMCNNNIKFVNAKLTAAAAKNNDSAALKIFNEFGKALGIGIANIINIFNIELVTIGGGISQAAEFFKDSLTNEIKQRAFKVPAENCSIQASKLGIDAGIIGASALSASVK